MEARERTSTISQSDPGAVHTKAQPYYFALSSAGGWIKTQCARLYEKLTRTTVWTELTSRTTTIVSPEGSQNLRHELLRAEEEYRRAVSERECDMLRLEHAESALSRARALREHAEENERKGIRPIVWPTLDELHVTKTRLRYTEGLLHFAVSGIAGSGKSSLVNALRGLRNSDKGAVPTGVDETAGEFGRFPDADPTRRCVWYDMPGAGTLAVPDWKYFTDQGLYIFDSIIVLFDARLTETDVAILRNAARFDIPTYIVRAKSSQHIHNLAADMPADESGDSEDESEGATPLALERARETYIRETCANIEENLKAAELPYQRVYLIDKDVLVRVVKGKPVKGSIDEVALLQDIAAEIHRRQASED